MGRLDGKRALVIAAGQGIGRACALAIAREGAEVIAADIAPGLLAGLEGIAHRALDVRDRVSVGAVAHEVGGIDVLMNCAGYVAHGTLLDCDEEAWDGSDAELDRHVSRDPRLSARARWTAQA